MKVNIAAILVVLACGPALARANATGRSDGPTTYGGADTSYVIGAYDFDVYNSSNSVYWGYPGTGARYMPTGNPLAGFASVHLPNGAVVTRIELQGCDFSATGDLRATLFSNATAGGIEAETVHGLVETTGSPGCGYFSASLPPATASNEARAYYVQVSHGSNDPNTRFSAVRLFYHLQVSPSPAVATFPVDVPTTHPFFRFIVALAAAGITGGCGPGAYCPDAALTRGQMAVFFATALGLHFPN
jgi:hypothetical protein